MVIKVIICAIFITFATASILCFSKCQGGPSHRLRTPGEEIAYTARPKINSNSKIFRYGQSLFCLPHRPKFSYLFDLCLHWVSIIRGIKFDYKEEELYLLLMHDYSDFEVCYCLIKSNPDRSKGTKQPIKNLLTTNFRHHVCKPQNQMNQASFYEHIKLFCGHLVLSNHISRHFFEIQIRFTIQIVIT